MCVADVRYSLTQLICELRAEGIGQGFSGCSGKGGLNRACLLLFIIWPSVFPTCMNFYHSSDTANHKYI